MLSPTNGTSIPAILSVSTSKVIVTVAVFSELTMYIQTDSDIWVHQLPNTAYRWSQHGLATLWLMSEWPCNIIIIFNLCTAAFRAYCAILVRHSNFHHQVSQRGSPCKSTQRWKVELWVRNVQKCCLNADLHVTFRDLLHDIKLRHGTEGFTSPPKESMLRIFSP